MKKTIFAIVIIMALLLSIGLFVACGEDDSSNRLAQINVKFMVGDEVVQEGTYQEDESITKPDLTTYNSQTISYWYLQGTTNHILFPYKAGASDLVFVAYTIQNISVSFVSDGKIVSSNVYGSTENVLAPSNPTKEGYTFKYWSYNNEPASFPFDLSNYKTITELKFEAVFDKLYTITFMSDGEEYLSQNYYYGEVISIPLGPTVEQSTFIFWVDSYGSKLFENTVVTCDMTFEALYENNFYTINYFINSSATAYKTLYSSGKVFNLEYIGEGDFYGWYTTNKFTSKFDFSKKATSNINLYGKVYSSDYAVLQASASSQKITIDTTNFASIYKFDATYPTSISVSVGSGTVTAKYSFTCSNSKKVSIVYDMMEGTVKGVYGTNDAGIIVQFSSYSYSTIDYASYAYTETVEGAYYNQYLKELSVAIAKKAGETIHENYLSLKNGDIVTTGEADPTKDYSYNVINGDGSINVTTDTIAYSIKIQDSNGDYIAYKKLTSNLNLTNLSSGTYIAIITFENSTSSYMLRQIYIETITIS